MWLLIALAVVIGLLVLRWAVQVWSGSRAYRKLVDEFGLTPAQDRALLATIAAIARHYPTFNRPLLSRPCALYVSTHDGADLHNAAASDTGAQVFASVFLCNVDKWAAAVGELDQTGELPEEMRLLRRSARRAGLGA
jgi:hypothetical protein